jgi:hypothetical protein
MSQEFKPAGMLLAAEKALIEGNELYTRATLDC